MGRLARHARLRVFRVFARRLHHRPTGVDQARTDHRLLSEREAFAACADASLDLAAEKVQAAYSRGDLCVGAFVGDTLAGYCWFAFSAAPHLDGVWLDFPADLVYTYKSYVRPVYRGRGMAAAMYRFADGAALVRGRKAAIICVESHNWPSIAAALRGGFSRVGYAAYRSGNRLRAWCSTAAADQGLRFFVPCPTRSRIPQP
jgi:GNAT superfamily N-acetyltransferase